MGPERAAIMREAMASLSAPARLALRLRIELRMPPSYIARRLGLTTQETRLLLEHAMATLAGQHLT